MRSLKCIIKHFEWMPDASGLLAKWFDVHQSTTIVEFHTINKLWFCWNVQKLSIKISRSPVMKCYVNGSTNLDALIKKQHVMIEWNWTLQISVANIQKTLNTGKHQRDTLYFVEFNLHWGSWRTSCEDNKKSWTLSVLWDILPITKSQKGGSCIQ